MSGKKTTPRVFPSGLDEPQTQISMNYATSYLETTVLEYAKMPQKIPNSYGVATSQTFLSVILSDHIVSFYHVYLKVIG